MKMNIKPLISTMALFGFSTFCIAQSIPQLITADKYQPIQTNNSSAVFGGTATNNSAPIYQTPTNSAVAVFGGSSPTVANTKPLQYPTPANNGGGVFGGAVFGGTVNNYNSHLIFFIFAIKLIILTLKEIK